MPSVLKKTDQLIRESAVATGELIARSHLSKAWDLLQERDADGNPMGPLPYTEEALAEFEAAAKAFPDDVGILHHLAIAHHARAWDLEIAGDLRAGAAWETALGHWRRLGASPAFWNDLKAKLKICRADADESIVDAARQGLLEDLLNIHVDFVRHYCELAQTDRAARHVEIVKRARIPPAIKKRLIDKVFQAMTAPVPQARQVGQYGPALKTVEQFLKLFPNEPLISALRLYAELCDECIARLSYKHNWAKIQALGKHAEPFVVRLATHPDLSRDPLAQTALDELLHRTALCGLDRARSYLVELEPDNLNSANRDTAEEAVNFSLIWCRLGHEHSRRDASIRELRPYCLVTHAQCRYFAWVEVTQSSIGGRGQLTTELALLEESIKDMDVALAERPGEKEWLEYRADLRDLRNRVRAELDELNLEAM